MARFVSPRARADVLRCEQLDGIRRMAVRLRFVGSRPRWRAGVIRPVGGGVGTVDSFLETSCVVARLALATLPLPPPGPPISCAARERLCSQILSRLRLLARRDRERQAKKVVYSFEDKKKGGGRGRRREKRKEPRDRQLSSLRLRLLRCRGSRTLRQLATSLRSPRWRGVGPCAKLS